MPVKGSTTLGILETKASNISDSIQFLHLEHSRQFAFLIHGGFATKQLAACTCWDEKTDINQCIPRTPSRPVACCAPISDKPGRSWRPHDPHPKSQCGAQWPGPWRRQLVEGGVVPISFDKTPLSVLHLFACVGPRVLYYCNLYQFIIHV